MIHIHVGSLRCVSMYNYVLKQYYKVNLMVSMFLELRFLCSFQVNISKVASLEHDQKQ